MKSSIEIQLLSPLTRNELIALRDDIRAIEGMEAFDLILPTVVKDETTMGFTEADFYHAVIGGVIHFYGEQIMEFIHHKIKPLLKKHKASDEAMGGKSIEAVITEKNEGSEKIISIDEEGTERIISNREYSINPQKTFALLIGVSEYDDSESFSSIPPVAGNLIELSRVLNDKRLMGLPSDNITSLPNASSVTILRKLREVSRMPGIETLIVYYGGHGQNNGNGKLSLIAKDTYNLDERLHGAISYEEVEQLIKSSPASQKIIILDACHSGIAAQGSNADDYYFEPITGTYTLTSTSAKDVSYYKVKAPTTYFTGYILECLKQGVKNINPFLSLDDIYSFTSAELEKNKFPKPTRKFNIKNIDESKFFISSNPSFDLAAFQQVPLQLLQENKIEEADIAYYKLLDQYPDKTEWVNDYQQARKETLFNKLINEGDRLYAQQSFTAALNKYIDARNLVSNGLVRLKIAECNKQLATTTPVRPTTPVTPTIPVVPVRPKEIQKEKEKVIEDKKRSMAPLSKKAKQAIAVIIGIGILTAGFLINKNNRNTSNHIVSPMSDSMLWADNKDSMALVFHRYANELLAAGNTQAAIDTLWRIQTYDYSEARRTFIDSLQRGLYYSELAKFPGITAECDSNKIALIKKILLISAPNTAMKLRSQVQKCAQ